MKKLFICGVLVTAIITSCNKNNNPAQDPTENKTPDMVLKWNEAGAQAVTNMGSLPPMVESRMYAIINLAMHDALNNIVLKYQPYTLKNTLTKDADADAAVAQAAHDAIVSLMPPQKTFADSLLTVSLAGITTGAGKDQGIILGKAAAKAIIDLRTNDGAQAAQFPYTQGTLPGQYRSTPPFDAGANMGYVALPGWGKVKPFGLSSAAQFRPEPPYKLNSPEYTTDYNEIKKLGCMNCPDRTADQTQIGLFWLENVPHSWNRIARTLIVQNHLPAWKAARLFALLQMAEADANIGCFDAKFFYAFWRPITAVRLGDNDDNPNTIGDPAWNILAPPTPPVPDYSSNHSTDGGAAAEVIKNFFGKDDISFSTTSSSLPGITRNFINLSQAARETSLSRIYVGYHFRHAVLIGEDQGRKTGKYIFDNYLKEIK